MPCYVIQAGDEPFVKLGFSENVKSRLVGLQTASFIKLRLLRVIDGGRATERWLHQAYDHLWVEREWFRFDPSMLEIVPPIDLQETSDAPSPFDELLSAFGGRKAVIDITGARYNTITQWRLSGVPFRYWIPLLDAAKSKGLTSVNEDLLKATRLVLEAA
jgi:hypothetical protein